MIRYFTEKNLIKYIIITKNEQIKKQSITLFYQI